MIKITKEKYPDKMFNSKELKMGIEVELEHTNSRTVSKRIAKQHLLEDPKYYTHLKAMEKKYVKHR